MAIFWKMAHASIQDNIVAQVIAAEAGGEGYIGMQCVANVIANRARIQHKTPYEIVTQKNQFYGLTAKNRIKLYTQVKKSADYLSAHIMALPDKTFGALYFRQLTEPKFRWCKIETARYKNHIFYK